MVASWAGCSSGVSMSGMRGALHVPGLGSSDSAPAANRRSRGVAVFLRACWEESVRAHAF